MRPIGENNYLAGRESAPHTPLSALPNVSELLAVVTDAQGLIQHVNAAFERVSGYHFADLHGQPLTAYLRGPGSGGDPAAELRRVCDGGEWSSHACELLTHRQETRLVHWTSTIMRAPAGDTMLLLCIGLDMTDRLPAEALLNDERSRLRAILDTAVDGIITIDETAVIESVNTAAERIFGYAAGELLGCNVGVLMPPAERARHDGYIERYLRTGEARIIGVGRELQGQRKDGSAFPMELAVSEVRLSGRRMFTGIVRDVSERRRVERESRQRLDELAHASRLAALGELTSGIAHEINQPLAAVVSFAEASLRMLRSGTGSPELIKGALEQIATQGARAGDIVHNLRGFVRKGSSTRRALGLNGIMQGVLGLLSHDLQVRGVKVVLDLDQALPEVSADKLQIEQVMLNLVRNAIDAMNACPESERVVTIRTRSVRAGVEVSVTDRGEGLPPGGGHRLFETFYTTKPEGMGMGLAISRTLIQAHGGALTAGPARDGRGATFRFTLPVAASAGDA